MRNLSFCLISINIHIWACKCRDMHRATSTTSCIGKNAHSKEPEKRESFKVMASMFMKQLRPYLAAILLQIGYAGLAIIAKSALNQGMCHYTFSVYRNVIAAVVVAPFALVLERFPSFSISPLCVCVCEKFETLSLWRANLFLNRKIRPRMTFSVLYKIILLALLE